MARTALFSWLSKQVKSSLQSGQTMTRREFLKGMGAAAGLGLLTAPVIRGWAASNIPSSNISVGKTSASERFSRQRIVIVGAGLAGLATAYYLRQQGIASTIYEASNRLGGRMLTRDHFNANGMFVELGGELIDTVHHEILDLCQALQVPTEAFAPFDKGCAPAIFWSGGRIRSEAEVKAAFLPLVECLLKDIQCCFDSESFNIPTYRQPAQCRWLDELSLETYLDRVNNRVESWLISLIKAAYTAEYGRDADEQSALNLFLLIGINSKDNDIRLYGDSDEAFRIQGGSSRLIEALERSLQPDVPIERGQELVNIGLEPTSRHDKLILTFKSPMGRCREIIAEQAILALPFSVLRRMKSVAQLPLSTVKKRCIAEWGYGTNSKRILGFKQRFWRTAQGNIPANTGELYSDTSSQCFWESSRLQSGEAGILTNFLGGHEGAKVQAENWHGAVGDLETIYKQSSIELENCLDGNRAISNWQGNHWARGSYSCPAPSQYTTLMGAAGEPELNGRLHFVGEHCSILWLGYMNGAVDSALQTVKQIILPETKVLNDCTGEFLGPNSIMQPA